MNTKYVMNGGLAFTENKDLRKLEKYASEGWLLEGFAFGGFMYKLVEGPKQELTYTIDFASDPDSEYIGIFSIAGWKHIMSYKKQIHIFSAPKGTAPIYSQNEIVEGKYTAFTSKLGKWAMISFIVLIVSYIAMIFSNSLFALFYYPLIIIALLSSISFIFCFMPYVMYKIKEKNET